MRDYHSIKNQEILGKLVGRDVYHSLNHLMQHLQAENAGEYQDEVYNVSSSYEQILDGDQYRYVIDMDERGEFASTLYKIDEEGNDCQVFEIKTIEHANELVEDGFISDIHDCESVADYYIETNKLKYADHYLDSDDDVVWTESDDPIEAYEFWAVSNWFADKLKAQGEMVEEIFDFNVWGRTTTGQAILLDSVIGRIGEEMGILEGQSNEWSARS